MQFSATSLRSSTTKKLAINNSEKKIAQEQEPEVLRSPKVKKPWFAFLLNFLLAGAGFAYLGKWKWAAINLFGLIAAASVITRFVSADSLSIAGTAVPVMNGCIAMAVAKSMNAKLTLQSVPLKSLPTGQQDTNAKL